MKITDFSKQCRPMVPMIERWRGDARTQTMLMREIAVFRLEKSRRQEENAKVPPAQLLERARRERALLEQLREVEVALDDLPVGGGLEPTRMTFNRLVEFGDEEPDPFYNGKGPRTTAQRWLCGIRRLKLAAEVKRRGQDLKEMMLDEVMFNRMTLYIEMGLSDDVGELVAELLEMRKQHQTQWSKRKRRTDRWAFNFSLPDDELVDTRPFFPGGKRTATDAAAAAGAAVAVAATTAGGAGSAPAAAATGSATAKRKQRPTQP